MRDGDATAMVGQRHIGVTARFGRIRHPFLRRNKILVKIQSGE
jgi:hypothetical protein